MKRFVPKAPAGRVGKGGARPQYSINLVKKSASYLIAQLDQGCEMYKGKTLTLCRKPIAHVVGNGKVAICEDCWQHALEVGREIVAEQKERRQRVDPQWQKSA